MSANRWGTGSERAADAAGLTAGVVTLAVVYAVVGLILLGDVLGEPPLANAVALPGGLAVGLAVGLVVRRSLLGARPASALAVTVAAAGVAYLSVGGPLGVYASVAASPLRDLFVTVGVALVAAVAFAVAVYRYLQRPDGGLRLGALRSLGAAVFGLAGGLASALVVFVALTEALDPYIWPVVIVSGPVAIGAGLFGAVLAYRWAADERHADRDHEFGTRP